MISDIHNNLNNYKVALYIRLSKEDLKPRRI